MNASQPSHAALATYDRAGLLIIAIASVVILLFMFGCGSQIAGHAASQQAALTQTAADIGAHATSAGTHTESAGTHADNAAKAVADAQKTAALIPSAAPVIPPLNTASSELAAVKSELAAVSNDLSDVKGQVSSLNSQVQTLAHTVQALTDQNAQLDADKKKLKAQWDAAWIGGRAWFWIHTIEVSLSLLFAGLFVAEFVFDLPIHPLSWIIYAVPFVAKLGTNVVKGIGGAASSAVSAIASLFKRTAPSAPAPPATPNTPASGK